MLDEIRVRYPDDELPVIECSQAELLKAKGMNKHHAGFIKGLSEAGELSTCERVGPAQVEVAVSQPGHAPGDLRQDTTIDRRMDVEFRRIL